MVPAVWKRILLINIYTKIYTTVNLKESLLKIKQVGSAGCFLKAGTPAPPSHSPPDSYVPDLPHVCSWFMYTVPLVHVCLSSPFPASGSHSSALLLTGLLVHIPQLHSCLPLFTYSHLLWSLGLCTLGLNMGILRVMFSHTVPLPANTIPMLGIYRHDP